MLFKPTRELILPSVIIVKHYERAREYRFRAPTSSSDHASVPQATDPDRFVDLRAEADRAPATGKRRRERQRDTGAPPGAEPGKGDADPSRAAPARVAGGRRWGGGARERVGDAPA